jgi:hypothetical protein
MLLSAVYEDHYEEEEEQLVVEVEKDKGTSTSDNLIENRNNQLTPWS